MSNIFFAFIGAIFAILSFGFCCFYLIKKISEIDKNKN